MVVVPDDHADFRPTKDMVRQAVLNTLGTDVPGSRCADVCAGCGAMGFELLSRGAGSVDFVETDTVRARTISRHAQLFEVHVSSTVCQVPARQFMAAAYGRYDIICYDPPYGDEILAALVPDLAALISDEGVLVYEREHRKGPPAPLILPEGFVSQGRTYGKTEIVYIRRSGTGS